MNTPLASNPINAKRMLKNTSMLYLRHLFILGINLFTVRLVLNALGAEDFGIYNVIAGIVLMCSFFCGTMATSSQRYFSIELGRQNFPRLCQIFTLTLFIYALLAVLFFCLAQTIGLWFVNTQLTIPVSRIVAANWIYQTSIFAFLGTLLTTPYLALVISHEDMHIYAYISILEAVLKLGIALMVGLWADKLIAYGLLMAGISGIHLALYIWFCRSHYTEARWKWQWDKALFQEILAFSGWNLFGTVSTLVKNQGINILLNIFYGPLLNAAQSLANQVRGAVSMFATNFSQAMRPQISKSYAVAKYRDMFRLVFLGSKMTYFLMLVMIIPLFYNVEYVLELWLKKVPDYTVVFVQLLMIETLIESLSQPMASVNQATGKIALYQALIGSVVILNLPIAYLLLKWHFPVTYVYIVGCILMAMVVFIRLVFLNRVEGFSYQNFIMQVFLPVLGVTIPCFIISHYVHCVHHTLFSLGIDLVLKAFLTLALIGLVGLSRAERQKAFSLVKNHIQELKYAFRKFAFGKKFRHH